MTGKKFLLVAAAVVLAVLLSIVVFLTSLMLSTGNSIRAERYTPQSLLELLVLVATAVSIALLLRSTIRRARQV
jgi:hypothetical protein